VVFYALTRTHTHVSHDRLEKYPLSSLDCTLGFFLFQVLEEGHDSEHKHSV